MEKEVETSITVDSVPVVVMLVVYLPGSRKQATLLQDLHHYCCTLISL